MPVAPAVWVRVHVRPYTRRAMPAGVPRRARPGPVAPSRGPAAPTGVLRGQLGGMLRADVWWLAGQAVLLVLALVVVPATGGIAGRVRLPGAPAAGVVLVVAAVVVGLAAMLQLGRQLVPQPTPVTGGRLVESGLYGVVRHPIYLAVLLGVAGVVVRSLSVAGVALLVVALVFFDRKSAYEERLLAAAYPGYDSYRSRVRWKLVPGLR